VTCFSQGWRDPVVSLVHWFYCLVRRLTVLFLLILLQLTRSVAVLFRLAGGPLGKLALYGIAPLAGTLWDPSKASEVEKCCYLQVVQSWLSFNPDGSLCKDQIRPFWQSLPGLPLAGSLRCLVLMTKICTASFLLWYKHQWSHNGQTCPGWQVWDQPAFFYSAKINETRSLCFAGDGLLVSFYWVVTKTTDHEICRTMGRLLLKAPDHVWHVIRWSGCAVRWFSGLNQSRFKSIKIKWWQLFPIIYFVLANNDEV
jgi:hypothetical protein